MSQTEFLAQLIDIYTIIVIVAIVVSWLQLPPGHPLIRFTRVLTEPLLAPIRKLIPPAGGLDFSPMILLILLQIIRGLL